MLDGVVIQWARLGDILQTRVLLERWLKAKPASRIALCGDARYVNLVRLFPEQVEFWPVDLADLSAVARHEGSQAEFLQRAKRMLAELTTEAVNDCLVLTRSHAAALFAELLKPRRMLGYRRCGDKLIIPPEIEAVEVARKSGLDIPAHVADIWARQAGHIGIAEWMTPITLPPVAQSDSAYEPFRIGLQCDAGEAYRTLTPEWLSELVIELCRQHSTVTLFGYHKPAVEDALSQVARMNADTVIDNRGITTLSSLAQDIAVQNTVIGSDTGGLHLAAALGVPTIGLYFGGARASHTGPYASNSRVIQDPIWDKRTIQSVVDLTFTEGVDNSEQIILYPCLDRYGIRFAGRHESAEEASDAAAKRRSFFSAQASDVMNNDAATDAIASVTIIIAECGVSHYTNDVLNDLEPELEGTPCEVVLVCSGESAQRPVPVDRGYRVICERHAERLSFAEACNLGARCAAAERLLFLNNDTRIPAGEMRKLLRMSLKNEIVSPLLIYADGVVQNSGIAIGDEHIIEWNHGEWTPTDELPSPDAVSATALLMPRDLFKKLNGFDEKYVNGYEDLDLCMRAKQQGIVSRVNTSVRIVHYRGSSVGRHTNEPENLRIFVSRWHHELRPKTKPRIDRESASEAPVVFVSDLNVNTAGGLTRWIWPMTKLGWAPSLNYCWITTAKAQDQRKWFEKQLANANTMVIFRPLSSPDIQQTILNSRDHLRIIVDSDDIVLQRFSDESLRGRDRRAYEQRFHELLSYADAITTSTENLSQQLQRFGFTGICLPMQPWPEQCCTVKSIEERTNQLRIGFIGTPSHNVDLGSIIPALEQVLETNSNVWLYWWGCRPGQLAVHPRVRMGGPVVDDYYVHLSRLHRFGLHVAVVPLLNTPANAVKSPIKYFEYAGAGVPAVYSRVSPYSQYIQNGIDGMLAEEESKSWIDVITTLIKDSSLRDRMAQKARSNIEQLMKQNDLPSRILKILTGSSEDEPKSVREFNYATSSLSQ